MLMAIALMSVIKMSLNRLAFIILLLKVLLFPVCMSLRTLMRTFQTVIHYFLVILYQLCQDDNLILSSEVCLPVDSYTYLSEAWNTTSWLEHCTSTADAHASLRYMSILYNTVTTDHIPVSVVINVDYLIAMSYNESNINAAKIDWSALTNLL